LAGSASAGFAADGFGCGSLSHAVSESSAATSEVRMRDDIEASDG
jgi:hypothetical protein